MVERPTLAKSELEIAQLVWRLGKATVREVLQALPKARELDFKTVQTYLRRLESKGYLTTHMEGRSKVYRAKVRPRTVIREMVDDFVDRVLQGDALPLVQNLIQSRGMTREQIDRLRDMLDDMEDSE